MGPQANNSIFSVKIDGEKFYINDVQPEFKDDFLETESPNDFSKFSKLEFTLEIKDFNKKAFKKLLKMPRKLKKKLGTRKATNKLKRRMKAGHCFKYAQIKRAGLKILGE